MNETPLAIRVGSRVLTFGVLAFAALAITGPFLWIFRGTFSGSDAEKSRNSIDGITDHDSDWFHIDEFFDKEGSL